MSAPVSKRGSAGEVIGNEDNDVSGSSVADADALCCAARYNPVPAPRRTPQSWGTDGLDFYLHFPNSAEIKTFFFCAALMRFI